MSVRVFLDDISIWIGKLSKADYPLQSEWASFNHLGAGIEQKGERKENLIFLPDC